jgi:hypothetical protein
VCDGAKDDVGVRKDLIDCCLFVLSRNEKYLAATTNSLCKLDVMYSGSMLERM